MTTMEDYFMHLTEKRLASFHNWPYQEGCSCTPDKMAEAGFFHCPTEQEPDAVKCFVCGKELDGWEPDDDPWKEHKSHSPSCPFLNYDKPVEKLPVEDFLHLTVAIQKIYATKTYDNMVKEAKESGAETRKEMEKLAK
ncbi:baculoviral IAP repeat-containing protein 5-like [Liolophura sinensis]|uniref:baculoviral IAP repeat-containing protein 5-like n=1 Tax=Liolophura sinensis TaxID=3198878 RepID=UPI003158F517